MASKLAVIFGGLLFPAMAFSADKDTIIVSGLGTKSCADFVSALDAHNRTTVGMQRGADLFFTESGAYMEWANGFRTAYFSSRGATPQVSQNVLALQLRNYCTANPERAFFFAVEQVISKK